MPNLVQLQYPQPLYCKNGKKDIRPNGLVYADLDMPKTNNCGNTKKISGGNNPFSQLHNKSNTKTEYATLNFNDVGKEIDV